MQMEVPVKPEQGLAVLDSAQWQSVLVEDADRPRRHKSDAASRLSGNWAKQRALERECKSDDDLLQTAGGAQKSPASNGTTSPVEKGSRMQFAPSLQRVRKKSNNLIQVGCFEDQNGDMRDEYGFRVAVDDPIGASIRAGKDDDDEKPRHASVSKDKKRQLLSKEAQKQRQEKAWRELQETHGAVSTWSPQTLERWQRYVPPPSLLCMISQPEKTPGSPERTKVLNTAHSEPLYKSPPKKTLDRVLKKLRRAFRRRQRKDTQKARESDSSLSEDERLGTPASKGGSSSDQRWSSPASPSRDREKSTFSEPSHETSGKKSPGIKQLTSCIRTYGVPPLMRREMWLACSGGLSKSVNAPQGSTYEKLQERVKNCTPELAGVIERDLTRTFPTNYHFEKQDGIHAMRRVLLAYSIRNRQVGYCQSMNFLVALLLLHMEEKYAFWVLAAIVEDLVPGHYTNQMTGMHVDQRVFESLVQQRLPKVHAHLEQLELPLASVTYQWFLCLFVNALPLETTLRVWDCFMHEGAKALFRIGLAILKMLQKDILATCNFQDAYSCMTTFSRKRKFFRAEKLMKVAYDPLWLGSFPSARIAQLREQHLPLVIDMLSKQATWENISAPAEEITNQESDTEGEHKLGLSSIQEDTVRSGSLLSRAIPDSPRFGRTRVFSTSFKYQYKSESTEFVVRTALLNKSSRDEDTAARPRSKTLTSERSVQVSPRRASWNESMAPVDRLLFEASDSEDEKECEVSEKAGSANQDNVVSDKVAKVAEIESVMSEEDEDISEVNSQVDAEIPEEFSLYLPSLAYVLSAQQTYAEENES